MASKEPPQETLAALARLFDEHLRTPEGRKKFHSAPEAAGLPPDVAEYFKDLSYEELRLLARTYDAMEGLGLTQDVGGVRVSFL